MRLSYDWLKHYLPELPDKTLVAQALTAIGLEVEAVLTFSYLKDFSVARIESVEKHPNADRLAVCKVNTVHGILDVICGAPNVEPGMLTAYAQVGTVMPSGLKIKQSRIRGVVSAGMLCARDELGLSTKTSRGIMALNPDLEIGTNLQEALQMHSPVFHIAVTPNRGDCFSARGIARDLAAKLDISLHLPEDKASSTPSFASDISISCTDDAQEACPFFLARVIRNVRNGPSPEWLQTRLKEAGAGAISALVDVTNFMSFDRGQPMHVFDKRAVPQGKLYLRCAQDKEPFLGLDDKEYALPEGALVIADNANQPISLAGVMGGKKSGSYEDTTDIVLECAYFHPESIYKTGQKTHIRTEARTRYERGIDPQNTYATMEAATNLILELCGGEAGDIVVHGHAPLSHKELVLDQDTFESHIGMPLPKNAADKLIKLGYTKTKSGSWQVPSWRNDVTLKEDLFTDIWRLSYTSDDNFQAAKPLPVESWSLPNFSEKSTLALHTALKHIGFHEVIPLMMISEPMFVMFGGESNTPHIQNPISQDLTHIRQNLASTLTLGLVHNINHKITPVQLYEVGPVYSDLTPEGRRLHIGALRCGPFNADHWMYKAESASTLMLKHDVAHIIKTLGLNPQFLKTTPSSTPSFAEPSESAQLSYKNTPIGFIGCIAPKIIASLLKTQEPVAFLELDWQTLQTLAQENTQDLFPALPEYHPIVRDFSFILARTIPAQEVVDAVYKAGGPLVSNVLVFDRFIDTKSADNNVALGIRCIIQPQKESIDDTLLTKMHANIIDSITKTFAATLRQ